MNYSTPETPGTERLYYLDSLRSFCMLFGLFVHANTLGSFGWLQLIPFVSSQFRMATFFAASAMLSVLVLQKRPAGQFVRKRLIMLLVPFVAGVLLINTVTLVLIWKVHSTEPASFSKIIYLSIYGNASEKPENLVWALHLWFLFSLSVYAVLTPQLNRVIGSASFSRFFEKLVTSVPPATRVLFVAIMAAALAIFLRVLGEVVYPQLYDWWFTRATLLNFTFFLLGMLIAYSATLRSVKFDPLSAVIALLLIIFLKMGGAGESVVGKFLDLGIKQIVNVCAIFFLIWLFKRFFGNPSRLVGHMIKAIYTIYLFHYLFLYIVGDIFVDTNVSKYVVYMLAVAVSFVGGLILHEVISRVSFLSWLFNGRGTAPG